MTEFRTKIADDTERVKSETAAGSGAARASEGMLGLAKGLAILELFEADRPRLTIADAASATGTSRAAARRCLLTLAELGYLLNDGKFFTPRPRLLRLGRGFLETMPLARLAQPVLERARDLLRESVSLAVLDEGWSVFVARAEASRIVSTGVRTGARLPAYCSATGRVLLAPLTQAERLSHLAAVAQATRTPKTLTTPAAIAAALDSVAMQGYAISDEEIELGMRAAAVPVRDSRGHVIAAMSVSMASARVARTVLEETIIPILLTQAAQLEKSL